VTKEFTPQDLFDVIQGNIPAFPLLLRQQHSALSECRSNLPELVLTATAVRKVLLALLQRQVPPNLVQQWASFVQRGYIANLEGEPVVPSQPVKPIELDYEPAFEDQIAEVISRLEQIGDLIDGEVADDEIIAMLDKLSGPNGRFEQGA
jgi:hypothetical protein